MKTLRSVEWPKLIGGAIALVALFGLSMSLGQEPQVKDAVRATGYKPPTPEQRRTLNAVSKAANGYRIASLSKFQALPAAFDCREKGWVVPTGDQGNCGSCYLWSTIGYTLTNAHVKAGYGKNDGSFAMAVQYGMDCHNFGGCNGGWGAEVIDWACKNGWYAEKWTDLNGQVHNDYPVYTARSSSCRKVAGAKLWTGFTWGYCAGDGSDRAPTTLEIKTAMFNYGSLNIAIDAGGQFGSGTGTITSLGRSIDHEISCVAWDDVKDGGAFLLHNQWSTSWGSGGFRWVTYKAAANIVDWFWVSAVPLPPPPVPPDPVPPIPPGPGPDPGPDVLLTINNMLKPGTYKVVPQLSEVVPVGTMQKLKEINEKVIELQKLLQGKVEETKEPPKIEPPKTEPKTPKKIEPIPEQAFVPSTSEEWNAALRSAKDSMKPFVVGVGVQPPAGDWYTASANPFDGHVAPSILIAFPRGGDLEWSQEVLGAPEAGAIRSLIPRKKFNPDTQPERDPKTGNIVKGA